MTDLENNMLAEIQQDLKERMAPHVNSMCATADEVRIAWLLCQVEKLDAIVAEVHAWAVCAAIATPEDMAQNFPRIVEITSPDYVGGAIAPPVPGCPGGSAQDFIGYLIDNCEGNCFLSEELLQQWYADFLKSGYLLLEPANTDPEDTLP